MRAIIADRGRIRYSVSRTNHRKLGCTDKLSVPVVALPRALNDEAEQIGEEFLQSSKDPRFLVLGYKPSYDTLDWLSERASADYVVREIGIFEEIKVLEFVRRGAVHVPTATSTQ